MKLKWEAVLECDDEDTGEHTCWYAEVNHPRYGRCVWIGKAAENSFNIEYCTSNNFYIIKTCKSLTSAKRWVSMNLI